MLVNKFDYLRYPPNLYLHVQTDILNLTHHINLYKLYKTDICIPLCSSVTSFLQYTIRTFVRQVETFDNSCYCPLRQINHSH